MPPGSVPTIKTPRKGKKNKKEEINTKVTKTKFKRKRLLRIKCPICLSNLGKETVCSTKCGHVFCTACLQKALIMKPVCPTCRRILRGNNGYHPLYLNGNIL